MQSIGGYATDLKMMSQAVESLREAAEYFLVHFFEDSMLCACKKSHINAKRPCPAQ